VIFSTRRASANQTLYPDDKFIANLLGPGKAFYSIGVKDHLGDTVPIPEIKKNDATMVTAAVYPATQGNSLVNVAVIQFATVMSAHIQFLLLLITFFVIENLNGDPAVSDKL
jgi:hypothetical protein